MKYSIVIEKTGNGYGGYVVDVPGLHAAGDSPKEVRELLRSITVERLNEMRHNGERIPKPAIVLLDSNRDCLRRFALLVLWTKRR